MLHIYADKAATSPLSPLAQAAIDLTKGCWGNPSSLHSIGRIAQEGLAVARRKIADVIGCHASEILFTSGGTESNNWALRGMVGQQFTKSGKYHIVTSSIEHPSVLETCKCLEASGFEVTYLPVNRLGCVNPADVEKAITNKTALVSVMYVNNETGTVQPVRVIGSSCRYKGIPFHVDAVQGAGNIDVSIGAIGADLVSFSGHKIGAPHGTGVLYARNGIGLTPTITGGGQEMGLRAGTENVIGAIGMAYAFEDAVAHCEENNIAVANMRSYLTKEVLKSVSNSRVNGGGGTVPGIISFTFDGIDGEALVLDLDMKGIAISSGSACSSGSVTPSHVLKAMGMSDDEAFGSVRISINKDNTMGEMEVIAKEIALSVDRMRKI